MRTIPSLAALAAAVLTFAGDDSMAAPVALDTTSGQGLLWSAALVGVVGALGMLVVRRLARRAG